MIMESFVPLAKALLLMIYHNTYPGEVRMYVGCGRLKGATSHSHLASVSTYLVQRARTVSVSKYSFILGSEVGRCSYLGSSLLTVKWSGAMVSFLVQKYRVETLDAHIQVALFLTVSVSK